MTLPRMSLALLVLVCSLGLAGQTRAQGISTYTTIDYYADTDTLDAYSETDLDGYLVGDYDAYVSLTVRDQNGSMVSAASARDTAGNGSISIESLVYGTTPGSTYTAVGFHKAIADLWDYQPSYPYHIFYYDNYNFSSFQNQGIYAPWYYYFLSPGFQPIQRNTAPIPVGSTYDLDSVTTSGDDVEFVNVAVDDGTPVSFGPGMEELVPYKANVNVSCGGERFKVVIRFNLPQYSSSCCSAGNSIIKPGKDSKFELTQNPVYGYSYRFFPATSPPAAPDTSPPLAVAFVRRKADGSGSLNTLRVIVGGGYQGGQSYSTPANIHLNCN